MEIVEDIQIQSNIDEQSEKYVVVQLKEPCTTNEKTRKKEKSGLVEISSLKQLRHEHKRLKKDFKIWMPPSYQINEEPRQTITKSAEFNDVPGCIEYIKSCQDKRIILILSHCCAQNERFISEFKQLSQIALIYRRVPKVVCNNRLKRWSFERQFFALKVLLRGTIQTRVKDLDETSQLLLMEIFFTELVLKLPRTDKAQEDFLDFCRSTYKHDPVKLSKVEDFAEKYSENDAINWYTRSDMFIFRIINRVCASFDFEIFFKIRFVLRDLFMQLKKVHDQQLTTLLQSDITVYRGVKISLKELHRLRITGNLYVTRNFVSTSTNEDVALFHSGNEAISENEASVLISMHIDHETMIEKPIAYIHEYSQIPDESEVMLPMGLVFRTISFETNNKNSRNSMEIKMVRGKEEQEIEKEFTRIHLLMAVSPSLGMNIFQEFIQNSQCVEEYCKLTTDTLKSSDPEVAEQPWNMFNNDTQFLAPNNTTYTKTNTLPDDVISHVTQLNTDIQNNQNNLMTNGIEQSITNGLASTHHIVLTTRLATIFQRSHVGLIGVLVLISIIISVVVAPLVIIFLAKTHSTTAICPGMVCSVIPSVQNPLSSYQIERLNLTCSQSLSNLTIIQIVQRTYSEIHAEQNQNFLNYQTNMTHTVKSTEMIYTWSSLPQMHIVSQSFSHFVEVHLLYTANVIRVTNRDTWQVWFQSACKDSLYLSGTF